jgi:RNA polymerase sigma-70 factor (ECF subfamily)
VTATRTTPTLSELIGASLAHSAMQSHAACPDDGAHDEVLMQRYRHGDANAFQFLYRRYCDRLHRFILRIAANPAETDEIFQEVWIAVIRAKDRYAPTAKFVTYLFAIAHRRAMDRYRHHFRSVDAGFDATSGDIDSIDDGPDPGEIAWRHEAGQALLDAIATLPVLQREAFLLRAEGNLDLDQIAHATGTTRETAKSRLRYANRRLRDALENWR